MHRFDYGFSYVKPLHYIDPEHYRHILCADFVWFDDWILAFRATAGIGRPVYDAWTHVGHHDDDPMTRDNLPCGCVTINGSLPCDRHYRSRLLDTWPSASIDEVN